jgi:hypothetical protein
MVSSCSLSKCGFVSFEGKVGLRESRRGAAVGLKLGVVIALGTAPRRDLRVGEKLGEFETKSAFKSEVVEVAVVIVGPCVGNRPTGLRRCAEDGEIDGLNDGIEDRSIDVAKIG